MLLAEAVDQFLLALKADGLSAATVKWYGSILRSFQREYPASSPVGGFTVLTLRSYIVKLRERIAYTDAPQKPASKHKMTAASVQSHVTALHAFWAWSEREYGIANPMANIRRPAPLEPEPKAIDHRDFVRLFDATDDTLMGYRDRALLAFLADTGCRRGGLVGLKWEAVDLDSRTAQVTEKGRRTRRVVFTHITARFLLSWRTLAPTGAVYVFTSARAPLSPLKPSAFNQIFRRLKQKAHIEGRVNPHSFRHNFAREYLRNGGDIVSLARLLGHKDIKVTSDYYAIFSQDELAELHEKYSPLKRMLCER